MFSIDKQDFEVFIEVNKHIYCKIKHYKSHINLKLAIISYNLN